MLFRYTAVCVLFAGLMPCVSSAQSDEPQASEIHLELNALNETEAACRLTFVATNSTDQDIERAVFETVIFDSTGSVVTLSLFDFQSLPQARPRVRQFDVRDLSCASIGRVLINGASTCTAGDADSTLCEKSLTLSSRVAAELLG